MQKKLFFLFGLFFLGLFLSGSAFAAPMNTTNYSTSSNYNGVQISMIKYTPYPANPGEYIDVWVQASLGSSVNYAKFQVVQDFPFSVDKNQSDSVTYNNLQSRDVVMHFKVRVSKDAVQGMNNLPIEVFTSPVSGASVTKDLQIYVTNAQTNFASVVQDESGSSVSLAIANIGENTANSVIVKIPDQQGYRVEGTNGQMVGNLNSGDYSIVNFNVLPSGRENKPLQVEIDYTDNIGVRREVLENVTLSQSYTMNATSFGSGASGTSGSASERFANFRRTSSSGFPWLAVVIAFVIVGGVFFLYKKYPQKFRRSSKPSHEEGIPSWMKKEKEKSTKGKAK